MESYKHSCPVCGQHVEYTAGYCGQQMQCPMCGGAIIFPAIPPTRGGKSVADEPKAAKPARRWGWNAKAVFLYFRDFSHWNIVGQVAVPFLIVGALLAGAIFVKNKFSDQPEQAPASVAQAPVGGWDKMTALARADQKAQQDVQTVLQAKRALGEAERALAAQQKSYSQARSSDDQQAIQAYVQSAQRTEKQAQATYDAYRRQFQADMAAYRKLGGTVDYTSQIPNN
jgi:hypothetical protein